MIHIITQSFTCITCHRVANVIGVHVAPANEDIVRALCRVLQPRLAQVHVTHACVYARLTTTVCMV